MARINFSGKRTIIGRKELNLQNEIKIQNMILIAPDKFKGTLTATQVARIIDSELPGDCLMMPMADGGEGTAEAIASATPDGAAQRLFRASGIGNGGNRFERGDRARAGRCRPP